MPVTDKTQTDDIDVPPFMDEETNTDEGDLQVSDDEPVIAPPIKAPGPPAVPKPAGFWNRLLAFQIDLILLTIGGIGLSEVIHRVLSSFGKAHLLVPICTTLFTFALIAYFSLFESSTWKGTPGKRFLGLRVTTLRGKRLSRFNALARTGACLASTVVLSAGFFAVLFTRKNQALHDLSAKTLVLQKPEETLLPDSLARWEGTLIQALALVFMAPLLMSVFSAGQDVAKPLWSDHQRRSKVEQGIKAVRPIQDVIEGSVKSTKSYPKRIDDALLKSAAEQAKAVVVYNPANGVLNIQFGATSGGLMAAISIYPMPGVNATFKWNCRAFAIDDKLLPDACKSTQP